MAIWEDDTAGVDRGQRFDALGNKIGAEFVKINPLTQSYRQPRYRAAAGWPYCRDVRRDTPSVDVDITNTIFDPRTPHQNFDGINQGDFLWQNDNGQAAVWLLKGTTPISVAAVGGNPGADWHLVGDGDFNQDGRSDFLWQHDSGQAAVWPMNGINVDWRCRSGPIQGRAGTSRTPATSTATASPTSYGRGMMVQPRCG